MLCANDAQASSSVQSRRLFGAARTPRKQCFMLGNAVILLTSSNCGSKISFGHFLPSIAVLDEISVPSGNFALNEKRMPSSGVFASSSRLWTISTTGNAPKSHPAPTYRFCAPCRETALPTAIAATANANFFICVSPYIVQNIVRTVRISGIQPSYRRISSPLWTFRSTTPSTWDCPAPEARERRSRNR